jgi:hypothetical protein
MSFVNNFVKDKAFWLLIAIFILSLALAKITNGFFVLLPLFIFLLVIFLWDYISLAISILKIVKNVIYSIVKNKPVQKKEGNSIGDVIVNMEISFFKPFFDIGAMFLIFSSLIVLGMAFLNGQTNYDELLFATILYFFGIFIYMVGKHMKDIKIKNNP